MKRLPARAGAVLAAALATSVVAHAAPHTNIRVLSDDIGVRIHRDGSWSETDTRVIQPLTIAGVQSASQIEIDYPANFATVKIIEAYTETTSHRRIHVQPSEIFTQSTPDALQTPFLSDGRIKNVIFPAVTPGATIHLRYRIDYKRPYLPGIYTLDAVLSPQILTRKVSLTLTAPSGMPLRAHTRGRWLRTRHTAHSEHGLTASSSWVTPEYPPPQSASVTQYAPMAVITTAQGWQAIAAAYDKLATPAMRMTADIRHTAARVAGDATGISEVERLYRWVQQHIQSVSVDYSQADFAPPSAQNTLEHGMGDSNASVALLCALLHARGIGAVPAMLSTSPRYTPYPGPTPFAFDHFVAYVPAYHLFLDTSTRYAGLETLPLADQGKPVLIAGPHSHLTTTPAPALHRTQLHEVETLRLSRTGTLEGNSQIRIAGWRAEQARHDNLKGRRGPRLRHYLSTQFYLSGAAGRMTLVALKNRSDMDKPLFIHTRWQRTDVAQPGKGGLSLALPPCSTMNDELSSFVSQATRSVPSVLNPGVIEFVQRVRLPQGTAPFRLPRNQTLQTPFGSYKAHYAFSHGTLSVERTLKLPHFVVGPKAYPQLHRLALAVIAGQRQGVLIVSDKTGQRPRA